MNRPLSKENLYGREEVDYIRIMTTGVSTNSDPVSLATTYLVRRMEAELRYTDCHGCASCKLDQSVRTDPNRMVEVVEIKAYCGEGFNRCALEPTEFYTYPLIEEKKPKNKDFGSW